MYVYTQNRHTSPKETCARTPNFHVLVSGSANKEGGIGGDVDGKDGQLMAVQRQKEFERVFEEHFDCAVQQPRSNVLGCDLQSASDDAKQNKKKTIRNT